MAYFRRHLPSWLAVWLFVQTASAVVLVPLDCCAAHEPGPTGGAGCHEEAAAALCPMRAADGAPCPMHRAAEPDCQLRGTCDGPMATLGALLTQHGTFSPAFVLAPRVQPAGRAGAARERLVTRRTPPDPPPPRA
jgi:hypothetical protein